MFIRKDFTTSKNPPTMFENSLKYKSIDLFESTQILSATNPIEETVLPEVKQTSFLSPRRTSVQEVKCISCNHKHHKTDRIIKKYGVLETNHCPECNCESYWLA